MKLTLSEILYSVGIVFVMCFFAWAIAFVLWLGFGPSKAESERRHAMQVVQELDGCKVYRFYDKDYHYITRCGEKVTTQKNWDEYCGKACTHHRTENITTEGNQ